MNTVKFQKPPESEVNFDDLAFLGVSDKLGGDAIYFEFNQDIWYRYTTSRQLWERIQWVDDANPYDNPKISTCPTCKQPATARMLRGITVDEPEGVTELDQNND